MATHVSILAWRIPWTEEPGRGLQSVGLQRVGHGRNDLVPKELTVLGDKESPLLSDLTFKSYLAVH